jgi:hypothetical protein
MGKYFMPTMKTAEEFQSEAKEMGTESRIEPEESGGYNVITDDDTIGADKGDFVDTVAEVAHESAPYRREAYKDARDDWDDALPDESPIGKTQAQLDEMERREDKRLGRDDVSELTKKAEKEELKSRIRDAKRGGRSESGMGDKIGSAMKLMGATGVNQKAMDMYRVKKQTHQEGKQDMYSGDGLGMRELTRPRSFKKQSPSMAKPQFLSPIASMSTQSRGQGVSPLSVAALGTDVNFGQSPLAKESTKVNVKTTKIGLLSTSNVIQNPAASDMSIIARIAKQSSIISPISKFTYRIQNMKRGK